MLKASHETPHGISGLDSLKPELALILTLLTAEIPPAHASGLELFRQTIGCFVTLNPQSDLFNVQLATPQDAHNADATLRETLPHIPPQVETIFGDHSPNQSRYYKPGTPWAHQVNAAYAQLKHSLWVWMAAHSELEIQKNLPAIAKELNSVKTQCETALLSEYTLLAFHLAQNSHDTPFQHHLAATLHLHQTTVIQRFLVSLFPKPEQANIAFNHHVVLFDTNQIYAQIGIPTHSDKYGVDDLIEDKINSNISTVVPQIKALLSYQGISAIILSDLKSELAESLSHAHSDYLRHTDVDFGSTSKSNPALWHHDGSVLTVLRPYLQTVPPPSRRVHRTHPSPP